MLAQYSGWGHSPQVFDELKADYWQSHVEGQYSYGYNQDPAGLERWADRFYEHHRQLKAVLTPEEWSRAEASTLNAHYTSRDVIEHGLWAITRQLGFRGGRVLENSAGIGHILGLAPSEVAAQCHFTACELDSITGRILKLLYPQATVHVAAFQDTKIPPHSQDLTIGNFPFDKDGWTSNKYPFSLHNQFFARSLDLTVPGGLIVAITSDSTLDSPASAGFRRWMAHRADLVGAIRLPNNAFKKNAGTEVTTDILIFRKKDVQPFAHSEPFIHTRPMETGNTVDDAPETVEVNEYYHRHPEMMLGRMTRQGTMYEANSPALIPHPDKELVPQLQEAVRRLPANIAIQSHGNPQQAPTRFAAASADQKEGTLPQTEHVKEYMQYLIRRYEAWNALTGREKRENSAEPLVINGLAKKAAVDMRLVDPAMADDPGSKLNRVVQETYTRWLAGAASKAVQVLFADSYQSPGSEPIPGKLDEDGNPARRTIPDDKRFHVFRDIKKKLVAMGVPEQQIEDVHDHDSDRKKLLLFERVNKGEVRIIMGGTEKLGTGVNIQAKLKTLHHIDAPWRPADMEQREGRILRQGNENPSVEVLRYGVDRSFDANAYQRLDTKARFINSIMNGTNTAREAEDAGAEAITSFADAFAAISGNPLVRERFDLETRIRHLERLQTQFEADQSQTRANLRRARAEAESAQKTADEIRRQAKLLQPHVSDLDRVSVITADGVADGRDNAIQLLDAFINKHLQDISRRLGTQLRFDRQLGDIRDRRMSVPLPEVRINGLTAQVEAQIQYRPGAGDLPERISDPEIRYAFTVPNTDFWKSGHITTGRGFLEALTRRIAELPEDAHSRNRAAEAKRRQIAELSGLQDRPFTHAEELVQQRHRLDEVNALLADYAANQNGAEESETLEPSHCEAPSRNGEGESPANAPHSVTAACASRPVSGLRGCQVQPTGLQPPGAA